MTPGRTESVAFGGAGGVGRDELARSLERAAGALERGSGRAFSSVAGARPRLSNERKYR